MSKTPIESATVNYKSFFLTVDQKLEWTNKSFASDQAAIHDARLKLREGETVKIYSDTRVVWDSEAELNQSQKIAKIRLAQ